ncbi:hypothetical protein TGMAS_310110 [Toxoplasma gondii MAS]|uniref:Uncharacterized protein n=1 Tax=Toxoplasma gondii MAS TaxID=943118 RepID=A0A086QKF3_TOXGO|nr:hypothetical protein TGMAS_310110 [Toxoplasma gondii MAS]
MSPLVNSETNVHACRGANVGTLFMFERNAASSALQAWRADCRVCTVEEPPPPESRSSVASLFSLPIRSVATFFLCTCESPRAAPLGVWAPAGWTKNVFFLPVGGTRCATKE